MTKPTKQLEELKQQIITNCLEKKPVPYQFVFNNFSMNEFEPYHNGYMDGIESVLQELEKLEKK